MKRQTTMMKYGWRIANVGIWGLLHTWGGDELGRDQLAFFELILLAEHDGVAFAQSGEHLGIGSGHQANLHLPFLEMICRIYDQNRALAGSRGLDSLDRNGEHV